MQDNNKIVELISKYLNDELDESTLKELEAWKENDVENQKLFDRLTSHKLFESIQESAILEKEIYSKIEIRSELGEEHIDENKVKSMYWRWLLVASVVLLVGLASYLSFFNGKTEQSQVVQTSKQSTDIEPGSYKAKLTLSDGSVVVLDSAGLGELTKQGNVTVKIQNGRLIYDVQGKNVEEMYNTLTTSVGESYSTELADGSRIWLNSGSSVNYPVAFSGSERVIIASGEIYIEVSKDSRPFRVDVLKQSGKKCAVEVLGTSFNVMAYPDEEKIETTLLEGKIAFTSGATRKILTAGQQIAIDEKGVVQVSDDANTDLITAWKNEDFYFKSNNLKTIMRQLARWYGCQVEYVGKITEEGFSGQISRNKKLSEVLGMIEQSGIKFKIEGKKVTVQSE